MSNDDLKKIMFDLLRQFGKESQYKKIIIKLLSEFEEDIEEDKKDKN